MITSRNFYEATCDGCGNKWNNGDGVCAYPYMEEIEESIMNSEWHTEEVKGKLDKHYCRNCHHIGDNDEIIVKDPSK